MIISFLLNLFAASDSLWQVEYDHILEGLELMNMTVTDLSYDKKWRSDSFRLDAVDHLMDYPLETPDYVLESGRTLKGFKYPWQYFDFTSREVTGKGVDPDKFSSYDVEDLVQGIFTSTNAHLEKAFRELTEAEKDSLLYTAPAIWADEADSLKDGYAGALHAEFGNERDSGYALKTVDILRLAQKLNLIELYAAGVTLAQGVEQLIPLAQGFLNQENPPAVEVEGVSGSIYAVYDLPGGARCIIGGPGHNVYESDFAVIIDLGGNDVYEGRAAGAVGELGYPVSFVLDLSGDDVYRNHEKLVNQGGALFGAALLWDMGGHDSYTAFHISQGAGLFGMGILVDAEEEDSYRGGFFTQGAGNFGSGVLVDRTGDDTYRAWDWTQGLGGPWGYGLLVDDDGDDMYYAGGVHIHNPLTPDQYRSFSQGFGFGWRDVSSGGIGFLYDRVGNDKYISEIYAQATSYWFALGMLLDEQGNDLYTAAQYSQGAGIHLSVGALLDLEGDDHYFSRYGPSQGEGHDLAVGWLFDKDGDDVYYASGGQGIGLTNSVGIFVDTRGNDDYCSREALSQGGANMSRSTGGVGIFIDLEGSDRYTEKDKGDNNHVWTSGSFALGMDLEAVEPKKEPWQDTITTFPELDTIKTDSAKMARLFHYASLWEVRGDIAKVRTGRRMLIDDYGTAAVDYIFKNEFKTYDGLATRAIEEHFKEFKDTAAYYLYKGLHHENDTVVRNSITFLGELEIEGAADTLTLMLTDKKNKDLTGILIYSLGLLKARNAVPAILEYARDDNERMRLRVATSLSQIKDERAIRAMIEDLYDPYFTVRTTATLALAAIGEASLKSLEDELGKASKQEDQTTLIRAIRNVYNNMDDTEKNTEIMKRLAELSRPYLNAPYPSLREQALKLLDEVEGKRVLTPTELFLSADINME
ncbi:HEAT repeat domain-containing protein [candidate division WOR-3 bacterium]|nr:HEAT repeat domain-containing protein [candidate division WOR-3 bacterium]